MPEYIGMCIKVMPLQGHNFITMVNLQLGQLNA